MMRNVKVPICFSLLFLLLTFTAAGISPLATQSAKIGPYQLLLSFYSLPRVGQQLSMTIESKTHGVRLQFSHAVLNPAPSTDAIPARVTIGPESDTPGVYNVSVTPSVRGLWLFHVTVSGPSGSFTGDIPINVLGPPAMPLWLGWLIGLLPLPVLIAFVWSQVRWRARMARHSANSGDRSQRAITR
jgi:hypothetical protein